MKYAMLSPYCNIFILSACKLHNISQQIYYKKEHDVFDSHIPRANALGVHYTEHLVYNSYSSRNSSMHTKHHTNFYK